MRYVCLLVILCAGAMSAQVNQIPSAREIAAAGAPPMRGQEFVVERNRPSVFSSPAETAGPAGATSVEALKHKVPKGAMKANDRGLDFGKKQDHAKAIAEFEKAVALDPEFAGAHNNLGAEHFLSGRIEDAAREFRRAVELDPALALAHINLATAELALGNMNEAREHAQRGIALGDSREFARWLEAAAQ